VETRSGKVWFSLSAIFLFLLLPTISGAGVLKSGYQNAHESHFFDWKYAQNFWFEMNTWEKEEAEWAKYEADFKT
jgi:hypothetical protein